jgi:hypothetical protein
VLYLVDARGFDSRRDAKIMNQTTHNNAPFLCISGGRSGYARPASQDPFLVRVLYAVCGAGRKSQGHQEPKKRRVSGRIVKDGL